jgi:hypothetical protein
MRRRTGPMHPASDRVLQLLVAVIALAVVWIAVRPHLLPGPAEASRETVSISIDQIGGRHLVDGVLPVRCIGRLP